MACEHEEKFQEIEKVVSTAVPGVEVMIFVEGNDIHVASRVSRKELIAILTELTFKYTTEELIEMGVFN